MKKELIRYFKALGLDVYTNTKARGHQGFFLDNRIDVSKETREERVVPTLLHEFAHFIHKKVEPQMVKTGGSIEVLFDVNEPKIVEQITNELLCVTNFVDENSLGRRLKKHKEMVKNRIKSFESDIKQDYPNFMRSKKFKEFEKYIKKSKAKYLLKYDRVKFITPFLRREEFYSIDNIELDFPDMPRAFSAYIRLKSNVRKQAKISKRLNFLKKYYSKPTELFSRFVEGLYIDEARTRTCAPHATELFSSLLENGYYFELKNVFEIVENGLPEVQVKSLVTKN